MARNKNTAERANSNITVRLGFFIITAAKISRGSKKLAYIKTGFLLTTSLKANTCAE